MADNSTGWHLDKRVNVGHLLTTISLAVMLFVWANRMDSRITVLEVQQLNQTLVAADIRSQLKDVNNKLDRLIERRP